MDRLTLFRKGLLLIAVPLCFQLIFIGLVAGMRRTSILAAHWTIHSRDVIGQAEASGYRILSTHSAVQGLIITHDGAFAAEVRQSATLSRQALQDLVGLVRDNRSQTALAERVQSRAVALLDFIEAGTRMVEGPGMSPNEEVDRRRQSQVLLDGLQVELNQFMAAEKVLNVSRQARLDDAWRLLNVLLIGGLLLSILSSLLIALLFSRSISARISTLASNSQLLSDGRDLMPPLAGNDEIARLDSVFRKMAGTLATAMERERAAAQLASRRADEMVAINEQLREKAQENEMFVYSVSHDLRSPLVNLQGFSKELGLIGKDLVGAVDREGVPDGVRRQTRSLIDVEMTESVGFIQSAVTRLSGIIDALLRLSRAGRVEYRPRVVAVEPIVARVIAALQGTIHQRKARVLVGSLAPAHADPTAVEQIFANLIGNAVNYLDPDRPGLIEVSALPPEDGHEGRRSQVVYAVTDNGLGIAESYQGKIFTAFQRLHGDVAQGEGIGLALVRRIVERNGGRVWFESEAGRGTTFFFALPTVPDRPEPVPDLESETTFAATEHSVEMA